MYRVEFKQKAAKELDRLSLLVQQRIVQKLKFYVSCKDPLRFAKKLKDLRFGEYRFRIGNHRILFDVENHTIIILKVGHRKDIYKS